MGGNVLLLMHKMLGSQPSLVDAGAGCIVAATLHVPGVVEQHVHRVGNAWQAALEHVYTPGDRVRKIVCD